MYIYGAKFQEHCFNISRDIVYSVFYHFQLQTIWRHHWSNLHNRKTSISLKRKKIFQKEKRHSSVFWKAFQISRKKFSCHMHFKSGKYIGTTYRQSGWPTVNNCMISGYECRLCCPITLQLSPQPKLHDTTRMLGRRNLGRHNLTPPGILHQHQTTKEEWQKMSRDLVKKHSFVGNPLLVGPP